jgi:hypothetical protein
MPIENWNKNLLAITSSRNNIGLLLLRGVACVDLMLQLFVVNSWLLSHFCIFVLTVCTKDVADCGRLLQRLFDMGWAFNT